MFFRVKMKKDMIVECGFFLGGFLDVKGNYQFN